jgi:MFS superfamily sulfate permease-like transporter
VSISEFVRRPAALGLRLGKAPATTVRVTRPAAARPAVARPPRRVPVLCLACTLTDGRADGLAEAVLARLAMLPGKAGTVVLDLGSAAGPDSPARQELCALRAALQRRGTDLRLVLTSRQARAALAAAAEDRIGPDMVHDCARAAMLAAYALVPGPGLVDAGVRAALAVPPGTL